MSYVKETLLLTTERFTENRKRKNNSNSEKGNTCCKAAQFWDDLRKNDLTAARRNNNTNHAKSQYEPANKWYDRIKKYDKMPHAANGNHLHCERIIVKYVTSDLSLFLMYNWRFLFFYLITLKFFLYKIYCIRKKFYK